MEITSRIEENQQTLKSVGQFFYGENLDEPAFVIGSGMNGFKVDPSQLKGVDLKKKVKSARWIADFTPKQTGLYQFITSSNPYTHIFVDGKEVKDTEVILEEGEQYTFVILYFGNPDVKEEDLFQFEVKYTCNQQETQAIEAEDFSIPRQVSFEYLPGGIDNTEDEEPLLDTDNDGIYDEWEINGYTVINHLVVPWDEKYAAQGYKKYVSNPNESHTAGDPYSDLEKASGSIDRNIKKVAWDPLIAAYPSITVGMERLILSDNKELSSSSGKRISRETSSSSSASNTEGIDVSAGFSLFEGFSGSVTGHYSHTSTHTVNSAQTSGQDWSEQLGLNSAQAAYVNANIRYYNTGTAPVYKFIPTTNLVLGKETIATITGQMNQEAFSLPPDQTYPRRHLHAVALNTLDQFSSTPISMNINLVDRLENGEKLKLETTQFQGAFAKRDPAGGQVVIEENEWANYIPQIESVTTGILIDIKGGPMMERRIAAKDPDNPNDLTPELTLGRALEKAVGAYKDGENWYFKDEYTDEAHMLSPNLVHFIYDRRTERKIKKELEGNKNIKTIYDMTIRPGMNIQISVPVVWDDFKINNGNWDGGSYDQTNGLQNGRCYKIDPNKNVTYDLDDITLEANSKYLISMDVKGNGTGKATVEFGGTTRDFNISNGYKRQKMMFEIFEFPDDFGSLTISTNSTVYIDNFSIVKIGNAWDKLKEENKEFSKINDQKDFYFASTDLTQYITNYKDEAFIKKWDVNSKQEFKLVYHVYRGAFYIYDIPAKKVLTWDRRNQKLIFMNDLGVRYQLWFFQKSGNKGYNIVSAADRSKVLAYDIEKPDLTPLQITTLDEAKANQYFVLSPVK
ncbi:binary toxin-like calcium binding domain-containing protein [Paenibacillus dendritiformis]|uniref:Protective antigen n=1 Tax=Paenibacillus dendritiformis C454 TaxID=1131935 RepID=H3SHP6_9BACL|nr:binary toxin-like calcium binding domain-containing protein [Paenibacillus dendritiformis]EHQ61370.1 protective antigen [Paenibacillus dendritiformis C454]CAH8770543.1 peptidase [Paenibacillus dendritiformis]